MALLRNDSCRGTAQGPGISQQWHAGQWNKATISTRLSQQPLLTCMGTWGTAMMCMWEHGALPYLPLTLGRLEQCGKYYHRGTSDSQSHEYDFSLQQTDIFPTVLIKFSQLIKSIPFRTPHPFTYEPIWNLFQCCRDTSEMGKESGPSCMKKLLAKRKNSPPQHNNNTSPEFCWEAQKQHWGLCWDNKSLFAPMVLCRIFRSWLILHLISFITGKKPLVSQETPTRRWIGPLCFSCGAFYTRCQCKIVVKTHIVRLLFRKITNKLMNLEHLY